jgi:hypothetical protein
MVIFWAIGFKIASGRDFVISTCFSEILMCVFDGLLSMGTFALPTDCIRLSNLLRLPSGLSASSDKLFGLISVMTTTRN